MYWKYRKIKKNSCTYFDSGKEINVKDPQFKMDDTVRISKYKNISPKCYTANSSEEGFWLKKLKHCTMDACLKLS